MQKLATQLADFIAQFRNLQYKFIGGIQEGGKLTLDGPSLGPFSTWKEYMLRQDSLVV